MTNYQQLRCQVGTAIQVPKPQFSNIPVQYADCFTTIADGISIFESKSVESKKVFVL